MFFGLEDDSDMRAHCINKDASQVRIHCYGVLWADHLLYYSKG